MKTPISAPEGDNIQPNVEAHNSRPKTNPLSKVYTYVAGTGVAIIGLLSGGNAEAQTVAANKAPAPVVGSATPGLVAVNTTMPAADPGVAASEDPYKRQKNALIWLIKQGSAATPDTSDDAADVKNHLYDGLVADLTDDGKFNVINEGTIGVIASTIENGNKGDELILKTVNDATQLLTGKDLVTVVAAEKSTKLVVEKSESIKASIPLNETKEQEKIRKLNEKTLKDANEFFNDPKSFTLGAGSSIQTDMKTNNNGDMLISVKKGGQVGESELPSGWVSADYGHKRLFNLTSGQTYNVKINTPTQVKDAEALTSARIIFFKQDWTRINLEGGEDKSFGIGLNIGEGTEITIPKDCTIVELKIDLNMNPGSDGKIPSSQKFVLGKTEITQSQPVKLANE